MQTVRGMRDLMGDEMRVRSYLTSTCIEVFKSFGYEPLDSPVMELWETLSAKGGEEIEAETFKFTDKGDREVGLRFDLTVPLARIVATNLQLAKPFKRYAIGKAWRYDRPQAGRYREFMQADVDIAGSDSPAADAEVALVALEVLRRVLGENYLIRVNNRKILKGMTEKAGVPDSLAFECFRAIDKLDKIGRDGVTEELKERGIGEDESDFLLEAIALQGSGYDVLEDFAGVLEGSDIGTEGVDELKFMAEIFTACALEDYILFDMSLARGLDYYTGPVFEIKNQGEPDIGSIGGGGRYDKLIQRFGGQETPATGISLGIDRIVDILIYKEFGKKLESGLDIFIAPIKKPMVKFAMKLMDSLVKEGYACEVDLMDRPLGKLLEIADSKNVKYTIIVGKRDISKSKVSIRNMQTKETELVDLDKITSVLKK